MLEAFIIFARGGIILFSWTAVALKGNPVDALVSNVLLEERSGKSDYTYTTGATKYTLKWSFHNELELVFVAVYQSMLQLLYVDDLLSAVRAAFVEAGGATAGGDLAFNEDFVRLMRAAEAKAEQRKLTSKSPATKSANATPSSKTEPKKGTETLTPKGMPTKKVIDSEDEGGLSSNCSSPSGSAFDLTKLKEKGGSASKKNKKGVPPLPKETKGKPKVMRKWGVKGNGEGEDDEQRLDFTSAGGGSEGESMPGERKHLGKSGIDQEDADSASEEESSDDEVDFVEGRDGKLVAATPAAGKSRSWLGSMMKSVVGSSALSKADLAPILDSLKEKLQSKNVASEIAEKVCMSVGQSLEGKRHAALTRVSATVKEAMTEALTRILTPRRSTDILREARAARQRGSPYSIVFIGVNGVGKSTNLAKVAYWLLQHDLTVMIAACDTFRSGAVEQLRTHCRRLEESSGYKVPLFERGYEKDPAGVALEAQRQAKKDGIDVVLVDTAGRMQDNKPLMEALSKLIDVNRPDLCLFVGEALVGNDAVDQLKKFNQSLADMSSQTVPRLIDGVVLTKFDTVDEKVGAALSMVYESGAPIMFVGCGQTYTDIRKLNVKQITNCLLK